VLTFRVESVAEALRQYGEEATARWLVSCSDDELVRVASVVEWLLYFGPKQQSGASMMIVKACALAAVYVREGSPRNLARSRRGAASAHAISADGGRRPKNTLQEAVGMEYGVGDDAREFWGLRGQ